MLFEIKRWVNEATRSHPNLRQLLLKIALRFGVQPVSYSLQLQAINQNAAGDVKFLSGKRRLLTGVKPGINRYLSRIENAKKKYQS